ncbi:bifunctional lysylphosphatidylglycerol flippase/synthetase MprF [Pleomorphomonas oryzae]|uniref:bifunctional lysylphosphatidylglycerol flippase/synthetase MprF n=1 Tax=Pleomorphomonas oryzae TaxID=261934 RepID=UPI000421FE23|nr:bifunctional lysylphosphatidylglycerol flippase/synthetase MprF [Pleomorphomonas oryzae]
MQTSEATSAISFFTRNRTAIVAAVAFAVAALSMTAVGRLLTDISPHQLASAVRATGWKQLILALLLTAGSFGALSVYDILALRFTGIKMRLRVVAPASFCAYAVGNIAGFGPLTGGSIRYRFYAPLGIAPEAIASVVAYVTISFGIGLVCVGGVGLMIAGPEVATLVGFPPLALRALAGATGLIVLLSLAFAVSQRKPVKIFGRSVLLPRTNEIAVQLLATAADVSFAAGVLYILLPTADVSYPTVLAVYAVALGFGVLSHLPGGVGVFEAIIISGLNNVIPLEGVISALILYRVIYYVIPLLIAALLLVYIEIHRATAANSALAGAIGGVVPLILGAQALVLGAMFNFFGVPPQFNAYSRPLSTFTVLEEGAPFIGSLIGLLMVVVASGLLRRLSGAWLLAFILALLSVPLGIAKGMESGEAAVPIALIAFIACLIISRRLFDRPSSLRDAPLTLSWWLSIAAITGLLVGALLFAYSAAPDSHALWWQFEFLTSTQRSLRVAFGILLVLGVFAAYYLMRPPKGYAEPATVDEIAQALAISATHHNPEVNLIRMADKSIMFSSDGKGFLMYVKRGRSWISLFDPVGGVAARTELVRRFVELAREHGGRAVFYQVAAKNLSHYADLGLSAFKLGEEAVVDLSTFDIKGSRRGNLRNAINKAEREGVVFEIIPADGIPAILNELRSVSDAWLMARKAKEKTFSIGAFDDAYMVQQPVAVLKKGERIYAFANILLACNKHEVSIDLMRFEPAAPNGTMELLLTRLLLHFKSEGYARFNLGMAPLSGLSESRAAPLWHKLGRAAFEYGDTYYNFHGLRAFKSKFDPTWEQRYMAVAGGLNSLLALADVTFVIGGGLRGVVAK